MQKNDDKNVQKSIYDDISCIILYCVCLCTIIHISLRTFIKYSNKQTKSNHQQTDMHIIIKVIGSVIVFPFLLVNDIIPDVIIKIYILSSKIYEYATIMLTHIINKFGDIHHYIKLFCVNAYQFIISMIYTNWLNLSHQWSNLINQYDFDNQ